MTCSKSSLSVKRALVLCTLTSLAPFELVEANGIDRPTDVGALTAEFLKGINKGFMKALMPDGGTNENSDCIK